MRARSALSVDPLGAGNLLLPLALLGTFSCSDNGVKAFNASPTAVITAPDDGAEVTAGALPVQGRISDPDHSASELMAIWYLNGELVCEETPDTDGQTSCTVSVEEGSVELILEAVDPRNASGTSTITLLAVPGTSSGTVSIGPEEATTDTVLTASADAEVSAYRWFVDGMKVQETAEQLDGTVWFDKGQLVYAVADLVDGESATSNTIEIQNTPPGAPKVSVTAQTGCSSLAFDGEDDFVELGSVGSIGDFTIEAWIRLEGSSVEGRVLDYDGGASDELLHLGTLEDGYVRLGMRRADPSEQTLLTSSTAITDTDWHHLAAVRTGSDLRLYIDGVLEAEGSGSEYVIEHSVPMAIGATIYRGSSSPTSAFMGRISSVRLSSAARYSADFTPATGWTVDSDTIGLWMLAEGSGSTTADQVGSYDGALSGPAWVSDCPEGSNAGELLCELTSAASDADGDDVEYIISWTVDGKAYTGETATTHIEGDTIPAASAAAGKQWVCTVTPWDDEEPGEVAQSG